MREPLLRIEGLTYAYPDSEPALRDVDLEVLDGEFVVVCGRSGSGKSTLLRAACGLVPHVHGGEIAGSVSVAGRDVRDHRPGELARDVAFVAQDPESQVVSATVRSELALPLELRGASRAEAGRAVEEAALALAIPHLLDRAVETLSGGELQRTALAAALVARPRLVLLDEPTSQLDPVAGEELIGLLRRLNEEWGTAVILCEHRLERCLGAADRVVACSAGRIAFDGDVRSFLRHALEVDPAIATPAARLFDGAGLEPLPTSVKDARRTLAARGIAPGAVGVGGIGRRAGGNGAPSNGARRRRGSRRGGPVLDLSGVRVEVEDDRGGHVDVLRGVDLRVGPGERVVLMGRNGAGKSTLLRCAAGLIAPSRGRVQAPGGVALLLQRPGDYLVRERIGDELPGKAGRLAMGLVGLDVDLERDPRDLSGGERQRLALAIALAGRAPGGAVLLDEPTRGLDRAAKDRLATLVAGLADAGSGIVVATHDVEFAARAAGRVVLLGSGEVVADGPPQELLSGGWYFATEIARILEGRGVVGVEDGVRAIGAPA